MKNTKARFRPTAPTSGKSPEKVQEVQVRINCGGRTSTEALDELRCGLRTAALHSRDPLVVLENLGLLRDSVVAFIKGLSRMLVGYPRTVTFWESSGLTETFLTVMEDPS